MGFRAARRWRTSSAIRRMRDPVRASSHECTNIMIRLVRRNGWVAGLFVLLALIIIATKLIQPDYGASGFGSLTRAVLPFAFATVGQTVVVIAGGVDLSIAAMMALTSVTAATLMDGASEGF